MTVGKTVRLDFETARDLLDLIESERDGPHFPNSLLNVLMLRIARQMPEEELPAALGGTWVPCDDE